MVEKHDVPSNRESIGILNVSSDSGFDKSRKDLVLKTFYYKFYWIHFILFLVSLGTLVISQGFHVYIPVLQEFAAGFLVFWMPGFCIIFMLWDSAAFKPIYLLPLTLAFSQVVVITEGLLCSLLGILWTPFTVLIITSIFIVGSYCIAWRFKRFRLKNPIRLKKCASFEEFYSRWVVGKIIPKNFGYLFVVIALLGIYAVVSFPVLQDDDPWLHALVIRFAIETGVIRFDLYRGVVGLHIYASGFGLLAGWNALTIARWFPIFLVINGNLAFYLIIRRLFKNPQIANLGTFFISFTPLMYYWGVNNLWPNALAQPFGLILFFFLFDAMLRKTPTTRPQKWTYISIGLYFSLILRLIHGEIFFIYWLSALFVFIFYRKNRKSHVGNFIILLIALVFFLLFETIYPTSLFINPVVLLDLPPIVWVALIPGIILGYWILKKLTSFPLGDFEVFTTGKSPNGQMFYKFEKKYLKYVILLGLPALVTVFGLTFSFLPISTIIFDGFTAFFMFVEISAALLGSFIIRREEHRGKIILFWSLFFMFATGGYFAYDMLITQTYLSMRMLLFASPGLVLLGMGYVSYFLKAGNLNTRKSRQIIAVFAISAVTICSMNFPNSYGMLKPHEISAANILGEEIPKDSIIISQFKWKHALQYFGYDQSFDVLDTSVEKLFPENGVLDESYFYGLRGGVPQRQVFAFLSSDYLSLPVRKVLGEDVIGPLQMSQITQFENITWFNHIFSFGTNDGDWLMTLCLV